VRTVYGGDPTKSYVHPQLNTFIDRKNQTVRSVTGELMLDYGKGISVLNAPKAQGVTGFLKAAGGKILHAQFANHQQQRLRIASCRVAR
jgi:hypothetical protein